jgi:hypothetical protein
VLFWRVVERRFGSRIKDREFRSSFRRSLLGDTMTAYDTFADAANTNALKVVLDGSESYHTSDVLALTAARS